MESLSLLTDIVLVVGPTLPYVFQAHSMYQNRSSDGFSPMTCLVLLIANILRIFFRFGRVFATYLLIQSIVMIIAQILMLYVWFTLRTAPVLSNRASKFWNWDQFSTYLLYLAGFTGIMSVLTFLFNDFILYVEFIGTAALMTESVLGVPQALSNYQQRDASAVSYGLIGGWYLGDSVKTIKFILEGEPIQFLMCGMIQIFVDTVIVFQMVLYSK